MQNWSGPHAPQPAAFRELYGGHAAHIDGFHLRRARDADAAHELTAETFAQAWRRGGGFATEPQDRPARGSSGSRAM